MTTQSLSSDKIRVVSVNAAGDAVVFGDEAATIRAAEGRG